ncbi:hypothetical protein BLNAU_19523 [Blattamonas nauphoetae]|uniref:Uncharacterized protein n=1 Tax=Blattamonas nauphoetae TaxID=2049346 RepID=A0ABQ9X4J3_9EUKA|nr:hypothetical protein BLNAU_19523 [Blattamonas nauphoetae]
MVRDGFQFDEALVSKASKLLQSISCVNQLYIQFDVFLNAIGQDFPNTTSVIVDSVVVLISSPHPSIVRDILVFIHRYQIWSPSTDRLALVSSNLFPRLLSTPSLRDLSVVEDQRLLGAMIGFLRYGVWLSSPEAAQSFSPTSNIDPESVRDVVLNEVLVLVEPSLVHLLQNPFLRSFAFEFKTALLLISEILELSAFHQPTLTFVCSSRIPMLYPTLLSDLEHNDDYKHVVVWFMSNNICEWETVGADTWDRAKILLQTLEDEGFGDGLEQALFQDNSTMNGRAVKFYSSKITNTLGMNIPPPE